MYTAPSFAIPAALAGATSLSWALAFRLPSHRQRVLAAMLASLLGIDIARPLLKTFETLYVGAFLGWYLVLVCGVWTVLGEPELPTSLSRHARAVLRLDRALLAAAGISAVMMIAGAVVYHGGLSLAVSRAMFAAALAAQLATFLVFVSRGEAPDEAQRGALILIGSSVVDAAPGPWLLGYPQRDWEIGRWISLATWLIVAGWELRCLIRARSRSA